MADKLMYIQHDNTQNYPFRRLQLPTNQNSMKVPKVFEETKKKRCLKSLGTSVLNSPMLPSPCVIVNISLA